jgi:light-regulated signal transduction histidine kinase (bacteriophytochrome)
MTETSDDGAASGPKPPGPLAGPARPTAAQERTDLDDYVRAILNILEDFSAEKDRLADTQKAVLNILEDFSAEKTRLEATQKAILNILEDFDEEKSKVEAANVELRREVAERRQAEDALLYKTTELARSNAELEQFAYVASHDLQEPLRMVSSYVQLFEKRYRGQVDEQADKYIRYAVEGARRMQTLIAGLLEYSRMGRQDTQPVRVSAEVALDQALANLRSALDEAAVEVTHDPLPEVVADVAQLGQVFQNLVGNAVKFRRRDVPLRVHVGAESQDGVHRFAVQDNGIGIRSEYAERVFVIFQRLHTRAEYPGTGIGLAICKKVVERYGGRIWFESSLGAGTTFYFTLPSPESLP